MPAVSAQHRAMPPVTPRAAIVGLGLITPLGRSLWATAKALLDARTTTDILDCAQQEIDEHDNPTPGMSPPKVRRRRKSQDASGAVERDSIPPLLPTPSRSLRESQNDPAPNPTPHPALALTHDPALLTQTVGAVGRIAPWFEDPAIELADIAIRQAADDVSAGASIDSIRNIRTIVASSKGAILTLIDDRFITHRDGAAALGPHGWLAHRLRRRLHLGHTTSVVAACATSIYALHQARREIETGACDRILVVAVEAALHPIFAHTYKRLGVLAPINPLPAHRPRPLDNRRAGFTLVETAAAVLLERESTARADNRRIRGLLLGSALGTEPFDIVRPAPEFRALSSCVERAVPRGSQLSLIQPHATGTRDNDPRELRAIAQALPDSHTTPIYASKGALGHPLGASALVNLALGCAFATFGQRPTMPWLDEPIDCPFTLTRDAQPITPGPQLLTSAGFGGHVGALCFETTNPRATT